MPSLSLIADPAEPLALLEVVNGAASVGVTYACGGQLHGVGVIDSPRYWFLRPYSPDDAWTFAVAMQGRLARDLPVAPEIDAEPVSVFLARRLHMHERRLLAALPSGRYALVRTSRRFERRPQLLLGNELVSSPPNARVIGETSGAYAVAFGPEAEAAPGADGVLVGVAVLAYNGQDTMDGLWLFDLIGPDVRVPWGADRPVLVPITGALVVDALAAFRDDASRVAKAAWARERAMRFARWVADG